jgi:hypothetical protein
VLLLLVSREFPRAFILAMCWRESSRYLRVRPTLRYLRVNSTVIINLANARDAARAQRRARTSRDV